MSTSKPEQRKIALQKRRLLSGDEIQAKSKQICEKLESLEVFKNAKCVLSYMSSYDEVDPSYINHEGKDFCYPISKENGIMIAAMPVHKDDFVTGKFGIKSPNEETAVLVDPLAIDLVIVPCVAFDEEKRRLGHGKGYYDRFLAACLNAKFVCVAFEAQKLHNIVVDAYDIPMDYVISEEKIY